MESLGAVASIFQIASTGASLSLTLYNVAEAIGSANKDVRYVARDIALFSTVLKDLGRALDKGQRSRLYRQDAYETSRSIVTECEGVFVEIKDLLRNLLKTPIKDGAPSDVSVSLDRLSKFMWVFRKQRVQLLRSNLESLKSSILLQLAVLSYADKVSFPNENDSADMEELLALRSLVLAKETSAEEFQGLIQEELNVQDQSFHSLAASGAMRELSDHPPREPLVAHANSTVANLNAQLLLGTPQNSYQADSRAIEPASEERLLPNYSRILRNRGSVNNIADPTRVLPPMPLAQTLLPGVQIVSRNPSKLATKYAQLWNDIDRLELALRKVKTAKWEHERLEEKLLLQTEEENQEKTQKKRAMLSERLQKDLARFGLSEDRVKQSVALLQSPHQRTGLKIEVDHQVHLADTPLDILKSLGFPVRIDYENPQNAIIKRWLPDYLDDFLWHHTTSLFSVAEALPEESVPGIPRAADLYVGTLLPRPVPKQDYSRCSHTNVPSRPQRMTDPDEVPKRRRRLDPFVSLTSKSPHVYSDESYSQQEHLPSGSASTAGVLETDKEKQISVKRSRSTRAARKRKATSPGRDTATDFYSVSPQIHDQMQQLPSTRSPSYERNRLRTQTQPPAQDIPAQNNPLLGAECGRCYDSYPVTIPSLSSHERSRAERARYFSEHGDQASKTVNELLKKWTFLE